jgi:hypothetical protein
MSRLGDYPFALCLTHDVDRPYRRFYQALYFAAAERAPDYLRSYFDGDNPFWQFETTMELEDDLGVRSAWYFLTEPPVHRTEPRHLLDTTTWLEKLGRYDLTAPDLRRVVRRLDRQGWEVGLHGSYHTADDRDRLREEKTRIEAVVGHTITGGRQHHLRFDRPATWRHYRELGLDYDASLGSTTDAGFDERYWVQRPFDDDFVVFPLTVMDQTLPDPGTDFARAWEACESLLSEAAANDAVMTALWHPRLFAESEFPGHRALYRRLIETALERGAWVGPPADFYEQFLTDQANPSRWTAPEKERV